jgi:integrase
MTTNNVTAIVRARPDRETGALAPAQVVRVENDPRRSYLSGLTNSGYTTMRDRLRRIARLFGYADAEAFPWAEMRYEHVLAVRVYLSDLGRAPSTINGNICAMVGVAREAWTLGLLSGDDYQRMRAVKRARGSRLPPGRVLSREEIKGMLEACARDPKRAIGARDSAMLALMAGTGMRRSEVVTARLEHYDRGTGELHIIGKGNKERVVYLGVKAAALMDAWLSMRGPELGPLMAAVCPYGVIRPLHGVTADAVDHALEKRAKEVGLAHFSSHDLRRTYITNLLAAGGDLLYVQDLVGHADPKTTKRYDRRGEQGRRQTALLVDVP